MKNITEIRDYAKKNYIPIMKDGGIDFICNYIVNNNVKRILEIGSAIGYSAIKFAQCKDDVYVKTIEIDLDKFIKAKQNFIDNNLNDRIEIINEDALVSEISGKFDLIFIDAAKAQYIHFFERYKSNLSENGVIISDNLSFHGMVEDLSLTHNYSTKKLVKKIIKYRQFLEQNEEFHTDFYSCGDGISVSKKNKISQSQK
jgi:predicted O-methyltransferase YrrM